MAGQEFEAWFGRLYGNRWPELRRALEAPNDAVDFAEGLAESYRLDSASVRAAAALRVPEAGEVLDACAAPGGKSLVIAGQIGRAHV